MKAARFIASTRPTSSSSRMCRCRRRAPAKILVRVAAAGVAPWDALIREGNSKVSPQPPLTLGSDLSGVVERSGPALRTSRRATKSMASPTRSSWRPG